MVIFLDFCQFFINYGGKFEAHVTCAKYRPSPIPSIGLEIPILLSVKKGYATEKVFSEMETFIKSFYIEPDQIVVSTNNKNYDEEIDLDVEFVPDSEIEESQPTAENHKHDGNDSMEVINSSHFILRVSVTHKKYQKLKLFLKL